MGDIIGTMHFETLLNFKKKTSRELCPQTMQPFQPRRKYHFLLSLSWNTENPPLSWDFLSVLLTRPLLPLHVKLIQGPAFMCVIRCHGTASEKDSACNILGVDLPHSGPRSASSCTLWGMGAPYLYITPPL